jgi:Tfp pilus assembly protein PilE
MVELISVIAVLAILIPTIFSAYNRIQQMKKEVDVRQQLVQQTYEFFERINVLSQDYTIDYEEYFNRQMVGCSAAGGNGKNFTWTTNGSGHCDQPTFYGNRNSSYGALNDSVRNYHKLYYCSSSNSNPDASKPIVYQDVSQKCWLKAGFTV